MYEFLLQTNFSSLLRKQIRSIDFGRLHSRSSRKQYESILFMLIRMFQAALEESSATDFLASSAVWTGTNEYCNAYFKNEASFFIKQPCKQPSVLSRSWPSSHRRTRRCALPTSALNSSRIRQRSSTRGRRGEITIVTYSCLSEIQDCSDFWLDFAAILDFFVVPTEPSSTCLFVSFPAANRFDGFLSVLGFYRLVCLDCAMVKIQLE